MRERITSSASVEYVIVVKNTVIRCDNKTQLCRSAMLGISSSDKDGDKSEKMGRLIISVDDNSVGGYHNEGGEDQTWHNVLMI